MSKSKVSLSLKNSSIRVPEVHNLPRKDFGVKFKIIEGFCIKRKHKKLFPGMSKVLSFHWIPFHYVTLARFKYPVIHYPSP